jgi:hypothetical protein
VEREAEAKVGLSKAFFLRDLLMRLSASSAIGDLVRSNSSYGFRRTCAQEAACMRRGAFAPRDPAWRNSAS